MAKRPITDIEYQILADAITQCDSSNIDGVDGIKVPVGDRDVPIGGAKMRVKAIGGNPPSAWLSNTVAFTGSTVVPTNGIVDDNADTFAFTPATGYTASQHEYRLQINGNFVAWVQCSSNIIQVPDIAISIGGVEIRVIGFTDVLTNAQAFTESVQVTAYVRTTGNDGTGVVDNPSLPFLTINAAITSLASYNKKKLDIGVGNFNSPTIDVEAKTLVEGVGTLPVYDDLTTPTKLVGGTILKGKFLVRNSNVTVRNLGVDVGSEWVALGNAETDALAMAGVFDSGTNEYITTPINQIAINIVALNATPTTLFHSIIFEHTNNPIVSNAKTFFGVHGLVFKTKNGTANNIVSNKHNFEGLIIKSDVFNPVTENIVVDGFKYNSGGYGKNIIIEANSPINNVQITNFDPDYSVDLFSKSGTITNVNITDLDDLSIFTLNSHLDHYYKMEETSGDRIDGVGSEDLTATGISSTTGIIGNGAFCENGELLTNQNIGRLTDMVTINTWVKFDAITPDGLTTLFRGASPVEYAFYVNSGQIFFFFKDSIGDHTNVASASVTTGVWYMLTIRFYQDKIRVYVNGVLSFDVAAVNVSYNVSNSFKLGNDLVSGVTVDELGLWSIPLSPEQVTELYNSGSARTTPFPLNNF